MWAGISSPWQPSGTCLCGPPDLPWGFFNFALLSYYSASKMPGKRSKPSPSPQKSSKQNELTLAEKLQVIKASTEGSSANSIAKQFKIGRATVGRILKSRDELARQAENPFRIWKTYLVLWRSTVMIQIRPAFHRFSKWENILTVSEFGRPWRFARGNLKQR